jgi:hypothetical protein
MKPEIYAAKEGYKIVLGKAPVGDPKLKYRKEVERLAIDGGISSTGRRILGHRQKNLDLTQEEVIKIEEEVLRPYREYQQNLREYEEAFLEVTRHQHLNENIRDELKRLQQILNLRDEDVALIEQKVLHPEKTTTVAATRSVVENSNLASEKQDKYERYDDEDDEDEGYELEMMHQIVYKSLPSISHGAFRDPAFPPTYQPVTLRVPHNPLLQPTYPSQIQKNPNTSPARYPYQSGSNRANRNDENNSLIIFLVVVLLSVGLCIVFNDSCSNSSWFSDFLLGVPGTPVRDSACSLRKIF